MTTLTTLYRDCFAPVSAFIARRYPMVDAEDITQSAYVKYWRRFPDGNCGEREPFRVLLHLARLCAVNAIRKATRYRRSEHLRIELEEVTTPCGQSAPILFDHIPDILLPFAHDILAGMTQRELFQVHGEYAARQSLARLRECLAS